MMSERADDEDAAADVGVTLLGTLVKIGTPDLVAPAVDLSAAERHAPRYHHEYVCLFHAIKHRGA